MSCVDTAGCAASEFRMRDIGLMAGVGSDIVVDDFCIRTPDKNAVASESSFDMSLKGSRVGGRVAVTRVKQDSTC